jgi:hypothetical protein
MPIEDYAYEQGFATWLIKPKGMDLLAWSPKIDIARVLFDKACELFPGRQISTRQRGRVVRETDEHGVLLDRYREP